MTRRDAAAPGCPLPVADYREVLLAHGGGGRLMRQLVERLFAAELAAVGLQAEHDSATLAVAGAELAMTTDSYVVSPLRFPGGDLGSLAVHGTVNDLAMAGARPCWLSAAFILEEGLAMTTLQAIVRSMRHACERARVRLVTGDTKVVDRGSGDGAFVTTTGVGVIPPGRDVAPRRIRPGDVILINGDVARHGIAVLSVREGLAFESTIESDSAPLADLVEALFGACEVHCLRDLTRGGLASALCELAGAAAVDMVIDEAAVPLREDVQGACELLGLDPLYVANEGRCIAVVPAADAERALAAWRAHPLGARAQVIGRVGDRQAPRGLVELSGALGARRVLDLLSGEQMPRIC